MRMVVLEPVLTSRVTPSKKGILITDSNELHSKLIDAIERAKASEGPYQEIVSVPGNTITIYQVFKNENGSISVSRYFPIIEYEVVSPEEVPKRKLNKLKKEAGLQ
jgi:hypothetical protein